MLCRIADFNVEFKNASPKAQKYFEKYITDEIPQISFEVTEQDIDFETEKVGGIYTRTNSELSAFLRKFAEFVHTKNGFLIHAALIDVDGTGVAFSAPSGTGKTTHLHLWKQLLGDKVFVVNGDKPIVRFFENEQYPFGYGTPWCGKELYGENTKVPIKHFCFIERSDTNSCEKINVGDNLGLFFKQIYMPKKDPISIANTLKLSNLFLKQVTVWKIKCNMDISAAEVAYNTIFKEN